MSVFKVTLEGGACGGKVVTAVQLGGGGGGKGGGAGMVVVDPLEWSQEEQMSRVQYLVPHKGGKARCRVVCREVSAPGGVVLEELPVHVEEVQLRMSRQPQAWVATRMGCNKGGLRGVSGVVGHVEGEIEEVEEQEEVQCCGEEEDEDVDETGTSSGDSSCGGGGSIEEDSTVYFERVLPSYKAEGTLRVHLSVRTFDGCGHSMELTFHVKFLTYRDTPRTKESQLLRKQVSSREGSGPDPFLSQEIRRLRAENQELRSLIFPMMRSFEARLQGMERSLARRDAPSAKVARPSPRSRSSNSNSNRKQLRPLPVPSMTVPQQAASNAQEGPTPGGEQQEYWMMEAQQPMNAMRFVDMLSPGQARLHCEEAAASAMPSLLSPQASPHEGWCL